MRSQTFELEFLRHILSIIYVSVYIVLDFQRFSFALRSSAHVEVDLLSQQSSFAHKLAITSR